MRATDVFISSTCYDLTDLRSELGEFLEGHAFLVRMSDDYESRFVVHGDLDSVSSCLLNVDSTDVVVCVLDRRYGPRLPATHRYPGISATHAEIQHAQAIGKPIFTFVRQESFVEHRQMLRNAGFVPKWIDPKSKVELTSLIDAQQSLAAAITYRRSNWFDLFMRVQIYDHWY